MSIPAIDMDTLNAIVEKLKKDLESLTSLFNQHQHRGSHVDQSLVLERTPYPGYVKSDGTTAAPYFLPAGWSVARAPTGAYTVTHNLNTTQYAVVCQPAGAVVGIASIYAVNANDFHVSLFSSGASSQDQDFTFIVVPL